MKNFLIKASIPAAILVIVAIVYACNGHLTAFAWLISIAGIICCAAEVIDEDCREILKQLIAAPIACLMLPYFLIKEGF